MTCDVILLLTDFIGSQIKHPIFIYTMSTMISPTYILDFITVVSYNCLILHLVVYIVQQCARHG